MSFIKGIVITLLFYAMRIFPIKNNKIVFMSYAGRGFGSEGKCIYEAMGKEKLNYELIWICRDTSEWAPDDIKIVPYLSLKAIYEQATAHIWLDNRRKYSYVRKRKGQYYIHTWHGGGPCLKWVEKDAENTLSKEYVISAKRDSKMADVLVSGSEWRTDNMKKSFWFSGEIIKCDIFKRYNDNKNPKAIEKEVKHFFGIKNDCRLLLYAPTFRTDGNLDCYNIDYENLIKVLKGKYGGEWKIIVRLHPNIARRNSEITYSESVYNGSMFPQIEDLIIASDFLITDYSGCMFDGFRLKRRVLIYANDLESYIKNERGMYFDIKNLPAPFADSMVSLLENINHFDDEQYEKKRSDFVNYVGYYDEAGPELITERIHNIISLGK